MPGWAGDHVAEALPALLAQCRKLVSMPPDMPLGGQGLSQLYGGTAGQWGAACAAVRGVAPDDRAVRTLIEAWFQPYEINAAGLVTGFYEPQARGAWQRGGVFQTPVLARPTDLVETPPSAADPNGRPVMGRLVANHLVPYWTRAEIEAGSAGARTHPVLWLADPIDLFFLQIQGSGRVVLPDAHVVRLAFAGSNGRAYTPIGKKLIERHVLAPDQVTMQSIRAWLDANPAEARMLMNQNDHYVFFRLDADAGVAPGPPGALGVNLVPGRSAAVDRHFTPLASLLFLDTTDPLTRAPWRHLVLAQDLGTDVIGPARVDLFMGAGDMAALRAGQMRQPGTAYLLLPRPPA
jgi:membrane-bound lytic murein transglycosylase A